MVNALGERHPERVAPERGAVLAALRIDRREPHRAPLHGCGCFGAAEGLVDDTAYGRVVGAVRRRESPRAFVDHSKAEAAIGGARDGLDCAVLDTDSLMLALDR